MLSKKEREIFWLIWNTNIYNERPSLISDFRTEARGFNGRTIGRGKSVIADWPSEFTIYTQGNVPVDYFHAGGYFDIVSNKVKVVIRNFTTSEKVEFLPVEVISISTGTRVDGYWCINVLENIDALDWEKTVWSTPDIPYSNPKAYLYIIKPTLIEKAIEDSTIFQLRVNNKVKSGIYISDILRNEFIKENCYLGMEFSPIKISS